MGKLKNQYTVNLNDDDASRVEYIAKALNRKPCELLRLMLAPVILANFVELQKQEHSENKQPPQEAIIKTWKGGK